jgi:hypothetical protein
MTIDNGIKMQVQPAVLLTIISRTWAGLLRKAGAAAD